MTATTRSAARLLSAGLTVMMTFAAAPAFAQFLQLIPVPQQQLVTFPRLLLPQPPPEFSAGSFRLLPTARVDVDDGTFGFSGLDLHYQPNGTLAPINGAALHYAPGIAPGFFGCAGINYFLNQPVPVSTLSVGERICMITDAGRLAQLRIDAVDPVLRIVRVSYTTWQ